MFSNTSNIVVVGFFLGFFFFEELRSNYDTVNLHSQKEELPFSLISLLMFPENNKNLLIFIVVTLCQGHFQGHYDKIKILKLLGLKTIL